MHHTPFASGSLRAIALFEAAKGVLTLLAGFGLLTLLHRNVEAVAATIIRALRLHPEGHYPALFLTYAEGVTDARVWGIFLLGIAYSLVRFTEAYGLWHERPWAEWFGALAGSIYIPFELYELSLEFSLIKMTVLLVNILVIWVIVLNIQRRLRRNSTKNQLRKNATNAPHSRLSDRHKRHG